MRTHCKRLARLTLAFSEKLPQFQSGNRPQSRVLLIGHDKAKRAYAWQYQEGDQTKTVSVLEIPPVNSPESAVKVAIAAKAKQK